MPEKHPPWLRAPLSYMWNFDGDLVQAYTVWRHAVRLYCEEHGLDIADVFAGGPEGPNGLPGRRPPNSPDPWREDAVNADWYWPDPGLHAQALALAKADTTKRVKRQGVDLAGDWRDGQRQAGRGKRRPTTPAQHAREQGRTAGISAA